MKNIHVLPTSNPSRLIKNNQYNTFWLSTDFLDREVKRGVEQLEYQNIYITNDEEIKEGFVLHLPTDRILEVGIITESNGSKSFREKEYHINGIEVLICDCKKIILTTDQDLIKDGVQAIDDEFLEWFVKNSSCEEVKVEGHIYKGQDETEYEIIISKEEPKQELPGVGEQTFKIILEENWLKKKEILEEVNPFELPKALPDDVFYESLEPKQETLEEIAERYLKEQNVTCLDVLENVITLDGIPFNQKERIVNAFIKWQQERSYSEEEVKILLRKFFVSILDEDKITMEDWFEQFKKK